MVKLMRYFFLFVFLRVIFTRDMNLFALAVSLALVDQLDAKTQLWLPP